nr:MAG TPA: hypothetical protein [Caudoviricetes sp.]
MKKLKIHSFKIAASEVDSEFIINMITNIGLYLGTHPKEVIPYFTAHETFLDDWFSKHLKINLRKNHTALQITSLYSAIKQINSIFLRVIRTVFPNTFSGKKTDAATLKKLTELYIAYYTLNNQFIAFPYIDSVNAMGLTILGSVKFQHSGGTLRVGIEDLSKEYRVLDIKPLEQKPEDLNEDVSVFARVLKASIDSRSPQALNLVFNLNNCHRSRRVTTLATFIAETVTLKFRSCKKTPELENAYAMAINLVPSNEPPARTDILAHLLEALFHYRTTYATSNFELICSIFLDLLSDFEYTITIAKHPKPHPVLGASINGRNFSIAI